MTSDSVESVPPPNSPRIFRAMRRDQDGFPAAGSSSSAELGVRAGVDIVVDSTGNVVLDGSGMSVAPRWQDLPFTRIPKRLRERVPGVTGSNSTYCFRLGIGPFERSAVAQGLELIPDEGQVEVRHGVVAPIEKVPLATYMQDLAATRIAWEIDEA